MSFKRSCKRVIFETLVKRLPGGLQQLTVPEIKQIGGRAGRYRPAGAKESPNDKSNVGLVTSLEEIDLPSIQLAMNTEPPPLRAAGIIPPNVVFEQLSAYFPKEVPFEYLIKRLNEISAINPLFFMCDNKGQLENAEIIDTTNGLRVADQLTFMAAPMDTKTQTAREITAAYADCVAENNRGRLLDIPHLNLEVLERPVSGNKDYLHELESLHKAIILYSWLSFRFGGVFTDRTLAAHVKELVEQRMVRALTEFSANKSLRKDASLKRQIALQKQLHRQKTIDSQGLMPESAEGGEGDVRIRMNEDGTPRSTEAEVSPEEEMKDDLNEESFGETVDNEASSAELRELSEEQMLDALTGESPEEKEVLESEKPEPRNSA
jgi:ATP-dependent RNA helicase SUPV3L1/SUV3